MRRGAKVCARSTVLLLPTPVGMPVTINVNLPGRFASTTPDAYFRRDRGARIMDIARDARPTKRAGILDELLADGSLVLYDAVRREIITLNPVAAYVWECCTGEHDVREILADTRALFPDVTHVEADVLAFLDDLRGVDLITLPVGEHANH